MAVVARKRIVIHAHAQKRLTERRQDGVDEWDVYAACHKASEILLRGVPQNMKLKGFRSKEGVCFDIVVVDYEQDLLVVTVIGHKYDRSRRDCIYDAFRLHDLPYKQRVKKIRKMRKEWCKWKQ
jgi:hypothetical protein